MSWQGATPSERSDDSHPSTTRFMLRLDKPSPTTLEQLIKEFGASKAYSIRHLIVQGKPEGFPEAGT